MKYVIRKEPKDVYDSLWLVPNSELAKEYAFVYISTETGKCQGIYYVMRTEEARQFCCHKKRQELGRGEHIGPTFTQAFSISLKWLALSKYVLPMTRVK